MKYSVTVLLVITLFVSLVSYYLIEAYRLLTGQQKLYTPLFDLGPTNPTFSGLLHLAIAVGIVWFVFKAVSKN